MSGPIEVVGAVICRDGLIYCTQRGTGPLASKWEFPGGKLEPGESPQEALVREVKEELGCQIDVGDHIVTTEHEYTFATIVLSTFYCTLLAGTPMVTEHLDDIWLAPTELDLREWAPADLPAVRRIQRDLA